MNVSPDSDPDRDLDRLAQQLRLLRPAPVPAACRDHLASPPPRRRPGRFFAFPAAGWPLAAAAAAVLALLLLPDRGASGAVSVHRLDSTLVDSVPLALVEEDGRLWELVELRWRDEESLFGSPSPVVVSHVTERRELVTRPVHFD